jgi:hypothetical protein
MIGMAPANKHEKLSRHREGWEQVEKEEIRLLRELTVEESLRHLLTIQDAFESQLQRTESLFRSERLAYLEELQNRLGRLAKRMDKAHGRAV